MGRKWYKCIPPKVAHEKLGIYHEGGWNAQMDRYWESDDGYTVSSRKIRTDWGTIEHAAISRMGSFGDIPWAVKQEIKNELFGDRLTAIEVFPSKKHLIDVCDIYHLWVLPKDFQLPFGIHPTRDPQCKPVERGYDFNLDECRAWLDSQTRTELIGGTAE